MCKMRCTFYIDHSVLLQHINKINILEVIIVLKYGRVSRCV